jgi:hypothetical protein
MPRYFFDIQDGNTLIDPSGFDCKNDAAAIEKARTLAVGVSLDKPEIQRVTLPYATLWASRSSPCPSIPHLRKNIPPARSRSEEGRMPTCPHCDSSGWVCEIHPDRPWIGPQELPVRRSSDAVPRMQSRE